MGNEYCLAPENDITHELHRPLRTRCTSCILLHYNSSVLLAYRCNPSIVSVSSGPEEHRHGVSCNSISRKPAKLESEAIVKNSLESSRGTYHEIRVPSWPQPLSVCKVYAIEICFQLLHTGKVVHDLQLSIRQSMLQSCGRPTGRAGGLW